MGRGSRRKRENILRNLERRISSGSGSKEDIDKRNKLKFPKRKLKRGSSFVAGAVLLTSIASAELPPLPPLPTYDLPLRTALITRSAESPRVIQREAGGQVYRSQVSKFRDTTATSLQLGVYNYFIERGVGDLGWGELQDKIEAHNRLWANSEKGSPRRRIAGTTYLMLQKIFQSKDPGDPEDYLSPEVRDRAGFYILKRHRGKEIPTNN
jgi:hypothetical protein